MTVSGSESLRFTYNFSARVYCYTDGRWVGPSDNGPIGGNWANSKGVGPVPSYNDTFSRGFFYKKGEKIVQIMADIISASDEVTGLEFYLFHRTIDGDGVSGGPSVMVGSGVLPLTSLGSTSEDRRVASVDFGGYVMPYDACVFMAARPSSSPSELVSVRFDGAVVTEKQKEHQGPTSIYMREVFISNTATLAASHEWMGVASHGIYRSGWTQPRGTNSEPSTSERYDKGVIVSRNCTLEKVQIRGFTNSSDVDTVAMALRLYRADIFSTSVVSYSDDDEIIFNDIISDASNISTSSDQGIEIVLNKEVLRGQKICAYFKPYGSFTVNRSYLFEANFIFK